MRYYGLMTVCWPDSWRNIDSCGVDTAYVTVPVHIGTASISSDTSICIGNDVPLFATGGVSYEWSPGTYLDDPFSANPVSTPLFDISYTVEITTNNGCVLTDSVAIDVYYTPPVPIMPDVLQMCEGASIEITVGGAQTYFWYPNSNINFIDTNVVTVNPPDDFTYYCDFTNACGTTIDSVLIEVITSNITAGTDTIICPGETTPITKGSALAAVEGRDDEIGKNSIMELMKAVDEHIPQPDRPKDKPFLMPVEDIFSISGRGTVATGRIESGVVKTGDSL